MPHSQEKAAGVNHTAISFMKVKEPVIFEEGNPDKNAEVFFVLASSDHEEHLKTWKTGDDAASSGNGRPADRGAKYE